MQSSSYSEVSVDIKSYLKFRTPFLGFLDLSVSTRMKNFNWAWLNQLVTAVTMTIAMTELQSFCLNQSCVYQRYVMHSECCCKDYYGSSRLSPLIARSRAGFPCVPSNFSCLSVFTCSACHSLLQSRVCFRQRWNYLF